MENKTILVVDDTISNLDILIELLDDYDVIDVTSGLDALEIVEEEQVDLILLDIMMPDMDGYEVCKKLKQNPKTKDIPVIFITAKTDEESIEKAYDIGGSDYVTKPFKPKELLSRVKKELKIQELMNELKLLASIDSMTKLYNRRYFTNVSSHIFEIAKRENKDLSIIMIDIDKFKKINDTYGHQIGDEVIITLSNTLKENHRKNDIVCRYGGEEFVMLLPNTNAIQACEFAEELRKHIEKIVLQFDENELNFTISLGVSQIQNDENIEQIIKRADEALYVAKESGRNQVFQR